MSEKFQFIQVFTSQPMSIPVGFVQLLSSTYFETTKWISDPSLHGNSRKRSINVVFVTQDEFAIITKRATGSHAGSQGFVTNEATSRCNEDNIYISLSEEARYGFLSERILRLFSHELYHLLYLYKCPSCKNPLWFDEGMAEYIATLSTNIIPKKALGALYSSTNRTVRFDEADPLKFKEENYAYAYLFFLHHFGKNPNLIDIKQIINSSDPVTEIAILKGPRGDPNLDIPFMVNQIPPIWRDQ